jgi:hypothetical protein
MRVHYIVQHDFWLIVAVLLFFTCLECSGQVKRVKRYSERPDITTIVPTHCMKFGHIDNDTIYVSISADSSELGYNVKLFMFMPRHKDVRDYSLEIGLAGKPYLFDNGSILDDYNYIEYYLSDDIVKTLKTTPIDYISFNTGKWREPCYQIKTPDFFCKFLQLYK